MELVDFGILVRSSRMLGEMIARGEWMEKSEEGDWVWDVYVDGIGLRGGVNFVGRGHLKKLEGLCIEL